MFPKLQIVSIAISAIAMILLVLVTISTPTTLSDQTPFDVTRSTNLGGLRDITPGANSERLIGEIRFGTWGYCTARNGTNSFSCFKKSHGYNVKLQVDGDANMEVAANLDTEIKGSWTRG